MQDTTTQDTSTALQEPAVEQKPAEQAPDSMIRTVKLPKPHPMQVGMQVKNLEEIVLDFNKLTGLVLTSAERRYLSLPGVNGLPPSGASSCDEYCAFVAADISGLPVEVILELPGPFFLEITALVKTHLFFGALPE